MYDHTDSNNSRSLSEEWFATTFDELSCDYKDDFISYYNLNDGLEALLTWSSGNCCFSISESDDAQLTMNLGSTRTDCHVKPEIGKNTICNASSDYQQGSIYSLHSRNDCNNSNEHFTSKHVQIEMGIKAKNV